MTKRVFPVGELAYEERELRVLRRYPSVGRTLEVVECPFCESQVNTYPWSRAGSGKRCSCGAKLLRVTARKPLPICVSVDEGKIKWRTFTSVAQVERFFGKESVAYRMALGVFERDSSHDDRSHAAAMERVVFGRDGANSCNTKKAPCNTKKAR